MEIITANSNPKIKNINKLNKNASFRKEEQVFIVEGIRMFRELPVDRVKQVFVSETAYQRYGTELPEKGITEQDKKIAGYAHEAGKGIVIVVNKWDLYPNKTVMSTEEFTKQIRHELIFMPYANVVYVSALTQQRISRLPEMIKDAAEANAMRISTSVLNQVVTDAVAMNQPPMEKGKRLKILYTTQVKVKPPTFVIFCNEPEIMHFSYQRYLENQLREAFGFKGTPINIIVRGKNEDEA